MINKVRKIMSLSDNRGVKKLKWVLVIGSILTSIGCSLSDEGFSSYLEPSQFFSRFELEHNAYNLSMVLPYNTVQLKVAAEMEDGSPTPGSIVYTVSNPAIEVTEDGGLRAVSPIASAVIHASLTYDGLTRTDSAIVSVIDSEPVSLHTLAIRPNNGDSAKVTIQNVGGRAQSKSLPLIRESESGNNLSHILVSLRSSDTLTASVVRSGNNVTVRTVRPGRVTLFVSTFAYGKVKKDSLPFTVGWPLWSLMRTYDRTPSGSFTPILDFTIRNFTVGVGACLSWQNPYLGATPDLDLDLDINFEDSISVGLPSEGTPCRTQYGLYDSLPGNIHPFRSIRPEIGGTTAAYYSSIRSRLFTKTGVYPYWSNIHGTSGVITVCDELNDTTCAPARSKW